MVILKLFFIAKIVQLWLVTPGFINTFNFYWEGSVSFWKKSKL